MPRRRTDFQYDWAIYRAINGAFRRHALHLALVERQEYGVLQNVRSSPPWHNVRALLGPLTGILPVTSFAVELKQFPFVLVEHRANEFDRFITSASTHRI